MPILVTPPNRKAVRVNRKRFSQEMDLQKYIHENPGAIPIEDIKEDVQLLILERESPTPVGPIDILATDSDGDIYIIETKLYRNPDKRQVLAQVLDYGAALWGLVSDPDEWLQQLEMRRANKSEEGLVELFETNFGNNQQVMDGIKSSLQNGTYHFLILMDEVHSPLKNLILYINENSRFSVYAVEMELYEHDGYQILIPHLFGAESQKKATSVSQSNRRKWDEHSFFEDAQAKLEQEEIDVIRKIYNAACEFADQIFWGTGKDKGSFNPKVNVISSTKSLFNIYSDGLLTMSYAWLDDDDFAIRCGELLKAKFMAIKPLREVIETSNRKFPSVPISIWMPYTDELIRLLSNYVDECKELRSN